MTTAVSVSVWGMLRNESCTPTCCSGVENFCLDDIDGSPFGVAFEFVLLAYSFVAVAIIADEHLVVSLETLCVRWNVREDVAGASFMAFGSAAPEIIINAVATLKTVLKSERDSGRAASACPCDDDVCQGDDLELGIGAILGSGYIAFTFIPGCCGLAALQPLQLKRRPLGRDILAYTLALVLLGHVISDSVVTFGEASAMVGLYAAYLLMVGLASKCAHDSPGARWYPVTLLVAFVWISLFSTAVAAVVTRWGVLMCVPTAFLGLYVVAVGAEIPDTIQSVAVARRGYGSMAVSNSTGSQIINILIGLGFPWLMTSAAGQQVVLPTSSIGTLHLLASLQGVNVAVYFSLLLLPTARTWLPGDHSKATLGRNKGIVFLGVYAIALIVFPIIRAALP